MSPLSSSSINATFLHLHRPPPCHRDWGGRVFQLNREHAEPMANKNIQWPWDLLPCRERFLHFLQLRAVQTQKGLPLNIREGRVCFILYTRVHLLLLCKGLSRKPVLFALFFDDNSCVERGISRATAFVWCSPSHLGGVERKEEDEGEQEEQSKRYYTSDHFHACTRNIWDIFHSNIFNTRFSKKGKISWEHTSLQLEDKDSTNFLHASALQYSSPWLEKTYFRFHLCSPFNLVPRFDVL